VTSAVALDVRTQVLVAEYPIGATHGPRRLADHEFVWITRGSAVWSVHDGRRTPDAHVIAGQRLRPGMIVLARPGTVDHYHWDTRRTSAHAYVHFDVTDAVGLPPSERWPSVRSMAELPLLDGLTSYLLALAGDASPAARRRSDELVALLLDVFVNGPVPGAGQRWPDALTVAVEHVGRVWAREGVRAVPADELAAAAHVSTGHLFRLFRVQFGTSPARALEILRLGRAAVALQRSNATLTEVASLVGYANPYHLSRRFSEVYGRPPGAFRRIEAATDPLWPLRDTGLLALDHTLHHST
jgi:AraC family transcriptional regulator